MYYVWLKQFAFTAVWTVACQRITKFHTRQMAEQAIQCQYHCHPWNRCVTTLDSYHEASWLTNLYNKTIISAAEAQPCQLSLSIFKYQMLWQRVPIENNALIKCQVYHHTAWRVCRWHSHVMSALIKCHALKKSTVSCTYKMSSALIKCRVYIIRHVSRQYSHCHDMWDSPYVTI